MRLLAMVMNSARRNGDRNVEGEQLPDDQRLVMSQL
jgi:hypothetical protein